MKKRTKIIVKSPGEPEMTLEANEDIIDKVVRTIINNGGRQVRNGTYEIGDTTPVIQRFNDLKYR